MATIQDVAFRMRDFDAIVAPGSESGAWQDFVADCYAKYHVAPWHDGEVVVYKQFSDYWLEVAAGKSPDYDPETGSRKE
jgi:hypothetical protein